MARALPEELTREADAAADRAAAAWRTVAPPGAAAEALLRHGQRVWWLARGAGADTTPASLRALAAAAVLHQVGRLVRDRGNYAVRGARWSAIRAADLLPGCSDAERRLLGEAILFHRHRGPLPPEIADAAAVDLVRDAVRADRERRPSARFPEQALRAAEAEHPRGRLGWALRLGDFRERLRHPLLAGRVHRVRRPDR